MARERRAKIYINQDFRNKMSITLPLESDLSPHILVKELGLVQVK